MPPRRILAVSPDEAFADQLEVALQVAGGSIEVHRSLETLGGGAVHAALCVIHAAGELAHAPGDLVPRLTGDCRVIVVLPRANLAATVATMRASDRVAGVMIAEDLDARLLRSMATRALTSDVFGLEKAMKPGTQIHAQIVGEYHEKSQCVSRIGDFAGEVGVPRRHHEAIEQCIDEMLMNALYDAPVDAQGNPLFSEITTRTRISLRTEQTVVVQYACDGARFGISVRDTFGSLSRQTVLRTLHKCLHAKQQIDRRANGAGVGLFLMMNAASSVSFNVVPGVATEVICTFAIDRGQLVLEQLGLFWEPSDVSGRLASTATPGLAAAAIRPAERRSARSQRRLIAGLAAAIGLVVAAAGVIAWPRLRGAGHAAGASESMGTMVELDSQPTGAAVEIDGKPVGSTPLAVTSLVPGSSVAIVFKRAGYRDTKVAVTVPPRGERLQLVQPLVVSEDVVRIHLVSTPPGARVLRDGEPPTADRTYTPADVFVEAATVQRFTLTMPGHAPLVIAPFTPARGAGVIEKGGTLQPQ